MPRSKRLPRAEFRARGYKTVRTPLFSLKIKKNETDGARIGVVVGKNVEKTAVKRNFWKRQARAVLQVDVREGKDVILILSPAVSKMTKKQFRAELAKTINKEIAN